MIKPRLRSKLGFVCNFRPRRAQPKREVPPLRPEEPLTESAEEDLEIDSSDPSDCWNPSNESSGNSEKNRPVADIPEPYFPSKRPSKKQHTRLKEACVTRPRNEPGFELRQIRIAAVKKRLKDTGSGNVQLKYAKAWVEAAKMKVPEVKSNLSEIRLSRSTVERGDLMQTRWERKNWWTVDNAGYLDVRRAKLEEEIRSRQAEEKAQVTKDRAVEGTAENDGDVVVPEEPAAVKPYRPSYADND